MEQHKEGKGIPQGLVRPYLDCFVLRDDIPKGWWWVGTLERRWPEGWEALEQSRSLYVTLIHLILGTTIFSQTVLYSEILENMISLLKGRENRYKKVKCLVSHCSPNTSWIHSQDQRCLTSELRVNYFKKEEQNRSNPYCSPKEKYYQ